MSRDSQNNECVFCDKPLKQWRAHFYQCPACKNIFNAHYQKIVYEDNYFEGEYRKQYGKSYFDDKKNIQSKMRQRLQYLSQYVPDFRNKTLLEIGSAAGYFLEIAEKEGMMARGWEISKYMTEYANSCGNRTIQGDFFSLLKKSSEQYDVVGAFYVIEHFVSQKQVWQAFSKLIKDNGFLILSIPYAFGPGLYFHMNEWIKNHPADHFIDYTRSGIKKICSMFGFKLMSIYPEGIHPERFPRGDIFFLKYFYSKIQTKCAFSDTVFLVFQKSNF
ncbi:MAG: class I SAM-dependent methyltransferase [Spirochaetia bacterium]|nr:class I SAM-dependent methyltransferase [Spirochaetia bacterium]